MISQVRSTSYAAPFNGAPSHNVRTRDEGVETGNRIASFRSSYVTKPSSINLRISANPRRPDKWFRLNSM